MLADDGSIGKVFVLRKRIWINGKTVFNAIKDSITVVSTCGI